MIKIKGHFLFFVAVTIFIFYPKLHAIELHNNELENEIIDEHPQLQQKEYYKNLYLIRTNLMRIENRVNYLHYILQDKLNDRQFTSKLDPAEKLERAKRHLILGNPQAAIDEVQKNFKYISYNDKKNISLAYKILFEAHRMQGNYIESTNICSKMIILDYQNKNYFTDKWKMLCSYTFLQASQKISNEEFKKNLIIWSLNPFVADNAKYGLLSDIFVSLAIRKINSNKAESIRYLNNAIARAKERDIYLGKSYLTLALLNFENGKKEQAFSIIKHIALNSPLQGNEYRYFEIDNYTRLLAKLCFARLHASYGNLAAAETWYNDILKENKVTGEDFQNDEKNKIKYEYGQVLYKQKKYVQSELAFKSLLKQEKPTDLFFSQYNIKISKIILANILNKSIVNSEEGNNELIKLYKEATEDLEFIKNNDKKVTKNYDSIKKKILPMAALARDYGIESKEAKYFIQSYLSIERLSKNLPKNKFDFANSVNAVDYMDKGVSESIVLSCIDEIKKNFLEIKENVFKLDKVANRFLNKNSKNYEILSNHRLELLRRLDALDDSISQYKNNVVLKEKIYKPRYIENLIVLNKQINQSKALTAGVNYLSLNGINFEDNGKYETLDNNLVNSVLEYRHAILKNEIFPIEFYEINKNLDVYNDSLPKLFSLHKKLRTPIQSMANEPYNFFDENWIQLIKLNTENKELLESVKNRLESGRKTTLDKFITINRELTEHEDSILKVKNDSFNEFKKFYPILQSQLKNKIDEFNNYIQLSFAAHDRNLYELDKYKLNDEISLKNDRQKWLESLQKSLDWDLFR